MTSTSNDSTLTSVTERPLYREWLQPRTIPLLVLLAFHLILNIAIASGLEVKGDEIAGVVVGSEFSLIVLVALWCALGPFGFATRYAVGTTVFGFATVCLYICAERDGGGRQTAMTFAAVMVAQWLIYQMPLWHARWKGWSLGRRSQPTHPPRASDLQFGIAQLLVWTTFVAAFLGVSRLLVTMLTVNPQASDLGELDIFFAVALGNSLLVLPLMYACLSQKRVGTWMGIAALWALLVTAGQAFYIRSQGDGFFFILNLGQFVLVLVSLLLVRLAGIRLFRATSE